MGNEVTTPSVFGKPVTAANMQLLAQKAAESARNNPRGGAGDGQYMSFSGKRGIYSLGQDATNVQPDEMWLVDVTSFEEGWIAWKGGKPTSKRLSNIYSGVPVATPDDSEGGPYDSAKGDGWHQAKAFTLKSLDTEIQAYFSNNSVSGVSAIAEQLLSPIAERMQAGTACWPVISLGIEQFESQGFKNYKPKFDVLGWLTTEQMQELAEGGDVNEMLDVAAEDEPEVVKPVAKAPATRRRIG